jgi:hypothetical protein
LVSESVVMLKPLDQHCLLVAVLQLPDCLGLIGSNLASGNAEALASPRAREPSKRLETNIFKVKECNVSLMNERVMRSEKVMRRFECFEGIKGVLNIYSRHSSVLRKCSQNGLTMSTWNRSSRIESTTRCILQLEG